MNIQAPDESLSGLVKNMGSDVTELLKTELEAQPWISQVSVRREDEYGMTGNRVAAMMAPLPVWCQDPVARLDIVRDSGTEGQDVAHREVHRLARRAEGEPAGEVAFPPALILAGAIVLLLGRANR